MFLMRIRSFHIDFRYLLCQKNDENDPPHASLQFVWVADAFQLCFSVFDREYQDFPCLCSVIKIMLNLFPIHSGLASYVISVPQSYQVR